MKYLVTSSEMRKIDAEAVAAGIPAILLMEGAGLALAAEAERLASPGDPIAVLVGPGQNGGDGLCAARHLSSRGFDVTVCLFAIPSRMPAEARTNLDALATYPVHLLKVGEGQVSFEEAAERMRTARVVVDALLGTGQKGPPRPPLDAAVNWANNIGVPIVACDIPTGVDADTGNAFQPAVKATVTVTMGLPKVGLYVYPGRKYAGRIVVESLGLPPDLLRAVRSDISLTTLDDARRVMPRREGDHHKGLSGHVLVIGGSVGMAGAAALAAKAALRSGCGKVTLFCPEEIYRVCAATVPEVMVLPIGERVPIEDMRVDSIVLGPGLGRGNAQTEFLRRCLKAIASQGTPCVLDADGLNGLVELGGLSYLADLGGKFILTPHSGEMSRLMGLDVRSVDSDRSRVAKEAALRGKSIVCLKGAGTCVANSVGTITVNTTGDPAMATAGSGDVLSGVIAALVSQGLPLYEAAWLGVYWHGLAGEMAKKKLGSYGMLAGEISDSLPEARMVIAGGE